MNLEPLSRAGIVLIFGAMVFMGVAWKGQLEANAELKAEIAQAREKFEALAEEHKAAINAASQALQARDEIQALARTRRREANALLESCPDFANLPLPDSLRLFLQDSGAAYSHGPAQSHDSAEPR